MSQQITREREIKLLTELCQGDTYFAEYFRDDLIIMSTNIRNDHPIELGCSFAMENLVGAERERADKAVASIRDTCWNFCETLLCVAEETDSARAYERAVEAIGQTAVIKLKRHLGLKITASEIDYLVTQAQ